MDDTAQNQQRLLLAVVLSVTVLVIWGQLFPPPKPTRPARTGTTETVRTATDTETWAEGTQTPTAAVAHVVRKVVRREFAFEGQVVGEKGEEPIPYQFMLTNAGGGIESFELLSYRERDEDNSPTSDPISLTYPAAEQKAPRAQMAGLSFLDGTTFAVPAMPLYDVVSESPEKVVLRYVSPEGVVVEREYHVKPNSFELEMAVTIRNESAEPQKYRLGMSTALKAQGAMDSGGFLFMPPPDQLNAMCFTDGAVEREAQASLLDETQVHDEAVKWVGIDRQYFLAAIIQRDGAPARCRLSAEGKFAFAGLELPEQTLSPREEKRHLFTTYIGVKKPNLLTHVDSQLEAAIDYRILGLDLSILCQGLLFILRAIHGLTGSWGLAIMGLTILVKLVTFPLVQRQGRSTKIMAELRPELEKLKQKYPEDRQRQSEETMKLFREYNVSPLGGCVPLLLQMPIWFALYRALWVSVDLYQEPFLWIPDLTARDPFWILPVALVVVMFVQQKLMPSTMDPAQQKVMLYFMPLMFGLMMAGLPAGLSFYILVNSLLTIVQQHFINKSVGPIGRVQSEQEAAA